jgi:hypothetical protein
VALMAGLKCTAIFNLDTQAIQQLFAQQQCAKVSMGLQAGVVDLGGRVASTDQGTEIRKIVEGVKGVTQVKENFAIIPRPFCAVLEILEPIKKQAEDRGIDLVTSLNREGNIPDYYHNEPLVIAGKTPKQFDSYIYVDYYDAEGNVFFVFPNQYEKSNYLGANQRLDLGRNPSPFAIQINAQINAQLPALELITVIATKVPLLTPRDAPEPAESYLNELRRVLSKESAKSDIAATFHFIRTNRKK